MGYPCAGAYHISGIRIGCHHHPPIHNLNEGIQRSCNSYFCQSLRLLLENEKFEDESDALDTWSGYLRAFNLGHKTGIDLYGELSGNVPDSKYYDRLYKGWRWKAATVISLAIGQGELTVTPIQLANLYAILANGGKYRMPHLVKSIAGRDTIHRKYTKYRTVPIPEDKIKWIHEGMENVVRDGTAGLARIPGIAVCGKTGTAENPHGADHSIFAAFAPRENPKIAIAVVVENSGFGGSWAAPIASLMMEYYLKGEIAPGRKWLEDYILKADFIDEDNEPAANGQ
jgi:penicillin-binding protein 2